MKKDQVDLENAMVWIPDSKTPNGVAEVPLTEIAVEAFRDQMRIAGPGPWLFPSDKNRAGTRGLSRRSGTTTLRTGEGSVFPDLRSPFDVRNAAERRRRCGRVGDADASAR